MFPFGCSELLYGLYPFRPLYCGPIIPSFVMLSVELPLLLFFAFLFHCLVGHEGEHFTANTIVLYYGRMYLFNHFMFRYLVLKCNVSEYKFTFFVLKYDLSFFTTNP